MELVGFAFAAAGLVLLIWFFAMMYMICNAVKDCRIELTYISEMMAKELKRREKSRRQEAA